MFINLGATVCSIFPGVESTLFVYEEPDASYENTPAHDPNHGFDNILKAKTSRIVSSKSGNDLSRFSSVRSSPAVRLLGLLPLFVCQGFFRSSSATVFPFLVC